MTIKLVYSRFMNAREVAEQTRQRLQEVAEQLGSRRAAVDEMSGPDLSPSWLRKFLNGQISNPTIESVATLQAALEAFEQGAGKTSGTERKSRKAAA